MTHPRDEPPARRPRVFGRLAYVEADVASVKNYLFRHLDDCNDDRKESHRRYEVLSEKIDDNAKACIAKAENVGQRVDSMAWQILWKVLVGFVLLTGSLVAALLKFHPTL